MCKHVNVVEVPHRPATPVTQSQPAIRLCEGCGYEEDAWGTGYDLLKDCEVRTISMNEYYSIRARARRTDD